MNLQILSSLIPSLLFLVTVFAVSVFVRFYNLTKKGRKNPLTSQLLRSPGESLRTQIDELSNDINYYLMILVSIPPVMFAAYLSQIYFGGIKGSVTTIGIYVSIALAFIVYCFYKLWKLLKKRNDFRLGLDCEMAVGQELNQLMLEGCKVFHDFPVKEFNKEFNIDHIVVSPKGVFAVETKGRTVPFRKEKVFYNGEVLKFPGWTEKHPIEQARGNAYWLSKWLSKTIGEEISVNPVLAIPGWYIEREVIDDMFVFNGKNPQNLLKWSGSLSETLIEKISDLLEQKCRDVEPTAYKQDKK